jgi:hypothetical protein
MPHRLHPPRVEVICHTALPDQTERRLIGRVYALWLLAVDQRQHGPGYEAKLTWFGGRRQNVTSQELVSRASPGLQA